MRPLTYYIKSNTEASLAEAIERDEALSRYPVESGGCKAERNKTHFITPYIEQPAMEEDIRRSSRRHNGKSALELLGISPRKPRRSKLLKDVLTKPGTKVQKVTPSKFKEARHQALTKKAFTGSPTVKGSVPAVTRKYVEASDTTRITRKISEDVGHAESVIGALDISPKALRNTTIRNNIQAHKKTEAKTEARRPTRATQPVSAKESEGENVRMPTRIKKDATDSPPKPTTEPEVTVVTKNTPPHVVPKPEVNSSVVRPKTDGGRIRGSSSSESITEKRKASVSEAEPSAKIQKTDHVEESTSDDTEECQEVTASGGVLSAEVTIDSTPMVESVDLSAEVTLPEAAVVEFEGTEAEGVEVEGVEVEGVEVKGVEIEGVEVEGVEVDGVEVEGVEVDGVEVEGVKVKADETHGMQVAKEKPTVDGTFERIEVTLLENRTAEETALEEASGAIVTSPMEGSTVVKEFPKVKAVSIKRKIMKKKIVKAVVITPSGEKKEIQLEHGISTINALQCILAGTSSRSQFDIEQLAADVNKQIEESMHVENEPEKAVTPLVPVPEKPCTKDMPPSVDRPEKPVTHIVVLQGDGKVIEVDSEKSMHAQHLSCVPETVDAEHKMAYEALSQLANSNPGGQPVTIELGDATMVDMDWLQQQGLQVVVADEDEDRWHRQSLGIEDPPALAQLVNKMCTQRVRARPEKHLVASDDLQEMINRLQPDDNMSNHVEWITHDGDGRKMHCKHCKLVLRDKHQFRKHMSLHKKEVEYKPWKCPICHYRAPVRAQIARHVNIHGELKPFICKECGKGFNFKQKLLLHLKYHLDIRDRFCPYCELAFHEHKTLKNHLKKIHNVDQLTPDILAKVKMPRNANKKRAATTQVSRTGIAKTAIATPPAATLVDTIPLVVTEEPTPITIEPEPSSELSEDSNSPNVEAEDVTSPCAEKEPTLLEKCPVELSDGGRPKKTSQLYGTRKTFLYTQQYKMGLLPAADRNNVPVSEVQASEQSEESAETDSLQTTAERKRRRLVIPKITSTDQLEPVLQQYCRVEKVDDFRGFSQNRFFCQMCEIESFTSKTGFIHHLEQKHPDIRAWNCSECTYTCRMRSSLIVHMKLHTGIKDYPCNVCGKAFAFKQKLKNHMKHHMNLREHRCHVCDKAFNEKNDLTKHVKKVHNSERDCVCTVCQKAFKDQVQLRRHMDGHSNTRYLCEHCNKLYRSRVSLAQHMKCHTCMFHCEICDRNFGSYSGFMAHKVMHDESYEGYECELCKKVLHTKGSLTRHLSISHSNERPHACEECGKQFKTKKDLKNHYIVHETSRHFRCDVCEFTCKRPESLRVHQRRHSDVKPFQCGVCGKEYTQKHALETHLRHHTGKVEGSCPICGREFFTRYQLDTHIRRKHQVNLVTVTDEKGSNDAVVEMTGMDDGSAVIDGDEKPMTVFMCEECNSVFMSQDSLAVHILAEHMKQGWLNGAPAEAAGTTVVSAATESLLPPGVLAQAVGETIEESPIGNTVEVIAETDGVVAAAAAVDPPHTTALAALPLMENSFDGQQTIETLVSISDPGSTKHRLVSLIHPVDSVLARMDVPVSDGETLSSGEMVTASAGTSIVQQDMEDIKGETATQKLNALYEHHPEAYVAITDPNSNQEMLVAMPHSNFESLLAATEAGVEADGTFITPNGEDYITVSTPGSGETYVTIASDIEPVQTMVAISGTGVDMGGSDNCVAVAETIEIPIESECVTVLDDPQ